MATSRCEHAWRTQRPANDWTGFLPNLREVVRLSREEGKHLADEMGIGPYDALMDRWEPGMRSAELDRTFGHLKQWLPGLIVRVEAKQRGEQVRRAAGSFPRSKQARPGPGARTVLGFDSRGASDGARIFRCGA